MPRKFRFTRFSFRDLYATAGPAIATVIAIGVLAYWMVDPFPPRKLVLSTGQANSAYEYLGKDYAKALERQGIEVEQKPSLGSFENLERLRTNASGVDAAFVQSGSVGAAQAEQQGLLSIGSLFMEPVWIFYRSNAELPRLADFKGLRINLGQEGTGVPRLVRQLLSINNISPDELQLTSLENTPATVALLDGSLDGLVFSAAPSDLLVQMLLQTPGIRLFNFDQAAAYSRRMPFLSAVTLPRGIVDLGRDIPSRDYTLIAPMATLVVRDSMHPALIDLLAQAASGIHRRAGWFHSEEEFPQARYTEIPVAAEARRFYENGPPFLQQYLPYWMANLLGRMWVVLFALGALLLPLMRIVPPLYVWKVRSRIYRWYGQLRSVEQAIEDVAPQDRSRLYPAHLSRLDDIEAKVNQITIPLAFAEELYGLRSHINFVRTRLLAHLQAQ